MPLNQQAYQDGSLGVFGALPPAYARRDGVLGALPPVHAVRDGSLGILGTLGAPPWAPAFRDGSLGALAPAPAYRDGSLGEYFAQAGLGTVETKPMVVALVGLGAVSLAWWAYSRKRRRA